MNFLKNKNFLIVAAILIIVAIAIWFLRKKNNTLDLRVYLNQWASSDVNPVSRQKRIDGIAAMPDTELPQLYQIVSTYFTKNAPLPTDLQKFWDYAADKYGIGG